MFWHLLLNSEVNIKMLKGNLQSRKNRCPRNIELYTIAHIVQKKSYAICVYIVLISDSKSVTSLILKDILSNNLLEARSRSSKQIC